MLLESRNLLDCGEPAVAQSRRLDDHKVVVKLKLRPRIRCFIACAAPITFSDSTTLADPRSYKATVEPST